MKIHEYNEMMAYLTRPAAPTRQPVVQGGVIGKPGGLVEPGVTNYGGEIYRTNKGYGPEISTEKNVKISDYQKIFGKLKIKQINHSTFLVAGVE